MGDAYDCIVVGLGAIGSAAAYHLTQRGRRVLGLDAFAPAHTMGASHGESRIIRLAYFEGPKYVPLLRRSYDLWAALQRDTGEELLRPTGGLFIGHRSVPQVAGALRTAKAYALAYEMLDAAELRRRFPILRPRPDEVAFFETAAGILSPESCVAGHIRLATRAGGEFHFEERVRSWHAGASSVEIVTDRARYSAEHVIFAAGAWLPKLLPDLGLPLDVERIPVHWVVPKDSADQFDLGRLPLFLWETGDLGEFYGFPHLTRPGVKLARHHSGIACDPDTLVRSTTAADEALMRQFVRRCMPSLDGEVALTSVCMYTNTPDEDFVVDRHPDHPGIVFAGGDSGHAFKLSSVIGEILAELVTEGRAVPEAEFLRVDRLRAKR